MDYYEKLRDLKHKVGPALFCMSVAYLLEHGFISVKTISDETIDSIECGPNSFMTTDCAKEIVRTAREITRCTEAYVELIEFCQIDDTFDVRHYKPVEYWDMVDIINSLPDEIRAGALENLDLCEDDESVSDGYIVKRY